ncbi:single-stranded DNA-binding protein [Magnetospira sp. QH-2]|uniref:single-stranded DNA-binding protein n=1 Tax=Magnetospira sp. (strain QH-2) TaxID=1288970 RepID=UPI0003E8148F|nr:single-stranded DNA-binding protein [Magnetospira sp. QH-2]CCQ75777.1 Putative single-stranded DNA-binding protein 1 [Magnetospira sp. QH-2]
MFTRNYVEIVGHIGNVTVKEDGKKRVHLSVATSEVWKDGDEKKEKTLWHNITIFRPALVDFAEKYLAKGRYVRVEASLKPFEYEKDDTKHYGVDLIASQVDFLDKKPD